MSNRIKTVILDSSVWVSYLLLGDSNYKQAVRIVEKYNSKQYTIFIPEIVFFEVISVLTRENKQDLAKNFIDIAFNITDLKREEFLSFIFQYKDYLKTKTQDSLIIMHCLRYNVDYFETFDNKQKNIYNLIKSL